MRPRRGPWAVLAALGAVPAAAAANTDAPFFRMEAPTRSPTTPSTAAPLIHLGPGGGGGVITDAPFFRFQAPTASPSVPPRPPLQTFAPVSAAVITDAPFFRFTAPTEGPTAPPRPAPLTMAPQGGAQITDAPFFRFPAPSRGPTAPPHPPLMTFAPVGGVITDAPFFRFTAPTQAPTAPPHPPLMTFAPLGGVVTDAPFFRFPAPSRLPTGPPRPALVTFAPLGGGPITDAPFFRFSAPSEGPSRPPTPGTAGPSAAPSAASAAPSESSPAPSTAPSTSPSADPSQPPLPAPTGPPSAGPSAFPSTGPSPGPSAAPADYPTRVPSAGPAKATAAPSRASAAPSAAPLSTPPTAAPVPSTRSPGDDCNGNSSACWPMEFCSDTDTARAGNFSCKCFPSWSAPRCGDDTCYSQTNVHWRWAAFKFHAHWARIAPRRCEWVQKLQRTVLLPVQQDAPALPRVKVKVGLVCPLDSIGRRPGPGSSLYAECFSPADLGHGSERSAAALAESVKEFYELQDTKLGVFVEVGLVHHSAAAVEAGVRALRADVERCAAGGGLMRRERNPREHPPLLMVAPMAFLDGNLSFDTTDLHGNAHLASQWCPDGCPRDEESPSMWWIIPVAGALCCCLVAALAALRFWRKRKSRLSMEEFVDQVDGAGCKKGDSRKWKRNSRKNKSQLSLGELVEQIDKIPEKRGAQKAADDDAEDYGWETTVKALGVQYVPIELDDLTDSTGRDTAQRVVSDPNSCRLASGFSDGSLSPDAQSATKTTSLPAQVSPQTPLRAQTAASGTRQKPESAASSPSKARREVPQSPSPPRRTATAGRASSSSPRRRPSLGMDSPAQMQLKAIPLSAGSFRRDSNRRASGASDLMHSPPVAPLKAAPGRKAAPEGAALHKPASFRFGSAAARGGGADSPRGGDLDSPRAQPLVTLSSFRFGGASPTAGKRPPDAPDSPRGGGLKPPAAPVRRASADPSAAAAFRRRGSAQPGANSSMPVFGGLADPLVIRRASASPEPGQQKQIRRRGSEPLVSKQSGTPKAKIQALPQSPGPQPRQKTQFDAGQI
eukprot:TRINITY_DN1772_c0_g1_i4.p1 TRINITY_DN1772_c0_g1~~TRINITY_DN1772_c0_g1_i4.p1  ORF type:complete len:1089 (+),score=237.23 TRINITY_DN1772_c0_g1_i4:91-3267(+)